MIQNLSVEDTYFKANQLNVNGNLIDLTVPKIMGILNITEDSFYVSSRLKSDLQLLKQAKKHLEEGATFLDIGAHSTRPGAQKVSLLDEISKITGALDQLLKEFPRATISVDTFQAEIAQSAVEHGAGMINDISGFNFDPKMLDVLSTVSIPYVLSHVKGSFETMHNPVEYQRLVPELLSYFQTKISLLTDRNVNDIIIDPGFGFSKSLEQNYELLEHLEQFQLLGRPLLAGLSRKSMIYKKLGITPEESLNGTTVLNTIALQKGAKILRVHDVAAAKEIIDLIG